MSSTAKKVPPKRELTEKEKKRIRRTIRVRTLQKKRLQQQSRERKQLLSIKPSNEVNSSVPANPPEPTVPPTTAVGTLSKQDTVGVVPQPLVQNVSAVPPVVTDNLPMNNREHCNAKERAQKTRVILVTFDNLKKYASIARIFGRTYRNAGITKYIRWQQPALERTNFFLNNRVIFSHPKGFGGWAWKPFIIYDTLSKISEGEYVYYQDCYNDRTGFHSNRSVRPVIEFMELHRIDILPGLKEPVHNRAFMKKQLLIHFNLQNNDAFLNRKHLCASPIFVKKSAWSMAVIKEWMDTCSMPHLILPVSVEPGIQHNYDMSLWNCIIEKYKIRPLNVLVSKAETKNFNLFLKLFNNGKECNLELDPSY
jgi:hypothetical protein